MYLQVEDLIRQLRGHLKTVKTEGELKPFHSFNDIRERLRRPLKQLDITASDFLTVLRFLHKRGVVFLHDSPRVDDRNSPVVAINPQIIGFLLQRTIRSGEMHGEGSILSGFLPNVHPAMIWGVDPVLFADDNNSAGITGLQLIDFLTSVDLCAPLVPGAVLIPSLLPRLPPAETVLNLEDLSPKRVYILGYLPSFFWCHLLSRVLRALAFHRFLQGDTLLTPSSPSSLPPRPANPLVTPTGAKLFLWQKHFVFEDIDGSKLWLVVYEGGQLGPESTQYCGRIDVLLKTATRDKEALLLRIVTEEIDQLLTEKYPSLLDDYLTPSLVDVLVPLSSSWFTTDLLSPSSSPDSLHEAFGIGGGGRDEDEEGVAIPNLSYSLKGRGHSFSSIVDSTSLQSFSSIQGTLHEAFASIRAT
ncbi:PREDICTED: uncharacterized protein LOC109591600, partial [Amphimedon queenslandica]|uniref:Uncharacterized protein n=2 Tax=Amphimedon queenslandica TaxID=400682 RepID=A0AAN0K0I1_AMPQE